MTKKKPKFNQMKFNAMKKKVFPVFTQNSPANYGKAMAAAQKNTKSFGGPTPKK